MLDHSPFAIATAVALPEATPDFSRDLYIANAARSPEGDMVTLMSSSDRNFKKYLTTREPVDGYSIAQIEWSEDVGKTKVTISKDGQFATLTFNQSLFHKLRPLDGRLLIECPQPCRLVPSPGADQASRAPARGVIERNPKIASAPPPNAAAESRLEPPIGCLGPPLCQCTLPVLRLPNHSGRVTSCRTNSSNRPLTEGE